VKRIFTEHFGAVARRQSFDGDQGSETAGRYLMVTGDLHIVEVSWSNQDRISDQVAWVSRVTGQRKTIRDTCEAVMSRLVGDRALVDVMGRERDRIEREARDLIKSQLTRYPTGVHVITCRLGDVLPPPEDVITSFEDVNKGIQDRACLINEGKTRLYFEAFKQAFAGSEATELIDKKWSASIFRKDTG